MKFKISVTDYFSAAHSLRGYKGKCESLHGHNFKVKVTLGASTLDKLGMVCDFHIVKQELKDVLGVLDHKHLNELKFFKKNNPTSENIARFIFESLKPMFNKPASKLLEVRVWETEVNEASFGE
jgi:6-pyruvoyltetrahydropterin/6-carboxytetrahydropterin synthase